MSLPPTAIAPSFAATSRGLEGAVDAVVLEQVREGLRVGQIVDGDDFDVVDLALDERAQDAATDATETVDADLGGHDGCSSFGAYYVDSAFTWVKPLGLHRRGSDGSCFAKASHQPRTRVRADPLRVDRVTRSRLRFARQQSRVNACSTYAISASVISAWQGTLSSSRVARSDSANDSRPAYAANGGHAASVVG